MGDQHRARRTIEILKLNRAGACVLRMKAAKAIRRATTAEDFFDLDYRYLIPLCQDN